MTVLAPAPTAIRQFHYDAATRTFTAEVSSTNGLGRVYDDACDDGLTVVGATGRKVVFVVARVERDREGDLLAWHLTDVDGAGFRMTLWND